MFRRWVAATLVFVSRVFPCVASESRNVARRMLRNRGGQREPVKGAARNDDAMDRLQYSGKVLGK